MVRIYGVARSRATRPIWLMKELGQAFDHVPVMQAYRLKAGAAEPPLNTRSPEFLALSPAGAIPVLQDGGLVLSESVAITLYLARRFGGPLAPADAAEDALMQQWGLYGATSVEEPALVITFAHRDGKTGTPEVAAACDQLRRPFAVLDAHLAAQDYLVGGRFTAADINMAEMVRYASPDAGLMAEFPALHGWLKRLHTRPAFQAMWAMRVAEPE